MSSDQRLRGFLLALLVLFFCSMVYYAFLFPLDPERGEEILIRAGETAEDVGATLEEKGIARKTPFLVLARLTGLDRSLPRGRYRIPRGLWPIRVLWFLSFERRNIPVKVTILEGLTVPEIAHTLTRSLEIDSQRFVNLVKDADFIRSLRRYYKEIGEGSTLEGYLFPDTYEITPGEKEERVIEILLERLILLWRSRYKKRADSLRWTLRKTLTLASIIEKEALFDYERPLISAVFHNRLKIGMPLESCATVEYLLPKRKPRLSLKDLEIDSPYNTYLFPGLPPGPIASPGEASIRAALFPASVPYLYFVAKGDGSHLFASKWVDHLKNKRKSRLRRRASVKPKVQDESLP